MALARSTKEEGNSMKIALNTIGVLATLTALPLGGCGSRQPTYVDARRGREIAFIDDTHLKYTGNWRDREWLYTAERDSKGEILQLKMENPQVGTQELTRRNDGCLVGEEGVFCPK